MTIRESIIKYLEENPSWQYAGRIARVVAESHEAKESNIERRMRELEDESKIESQYVVNPNGRGNKVVQYRLAQTQIPLAGTVKDEIVSFRPEFLKRKMFEENQKSLL